MSHLGGLREETGTELRAPPPFPDLVVKKKPAKQNEKLPPEGKELNQETTLSKKLEKKV